MFAGLPSGECQLNHLSSSKTGTRGKSCGQRGKCPSCASLQQAKKPMLSAKFRSQSLFIASSQLQFKAATAVRSRSSPTFSVGASAVRLVASEHDAISATKCGGQALCISCKRTPPGRKFGGPHFESSDSTSLIAATSIQIGNHVSAGTRRVWCDVLP